MLNKISLSSAIHIQHIIREATKHNIELLKSYLLLNKTLFKKYLLDMNREKFILHQLRQVLQNLLLT
jgi:hypothetical protein